MPNLDRRAFFRRLGLGALALGPVGGLASFLGSSTDSEEASASMLDGFPDEPVARPGGPTSAHALLSPLVPGSMLATSTLASVEERSGWISLELKSHVGGPFRLEILARDEGVDAPRPVTSTSRFDIFVANGGGGSKRTSRAHGLAAYALANVLARNEKKVGKLSLCTFRSRALG